MFAPSRCRSPPCTTPRCSRNRRSRPRRESSSLPRPSERGYGLPLVGRNLRRGGRRLATDALGVGVALDQPLRERGVLLGGEERVYVNVRHGALVISSNIVVKILKTLPDGTTSDARRPAEAGRRARCAINENAPGD